MCPVAGCASAGPSGQAHAPTGHQPGDPLPAAPGYRADLDEDGKRLLAARTNYTPGPGPSHVSIYSPRELDLGIPSGEKSPVGRRYFQIAVLITAREIDQQYEWTAHELTGRRQGLEQSVIDVVKYNKRRGVAIPQGRDTDHFRTRAVSGTPGQQ